MEKSIRNIGYMRFRSKFYTISLIIVFVYLFSGSLFAQYTSEDKELIQTTFLREFQDSVVYEYLSSDNPRKINAALLSISHSNDTNYVESIVNLNYSLHGKYIAFTLGQIGYSNSSINFLRNKLEDRSNAFQRECFDAIGKIGDSLTLSDLFSSIKSYSIINTSGFPYALTNFHFNGIQNPNTYAWLESKVTASDLSSTELFDILYALYRIGPTENIIHALTKLLSTSSEENILLYSLNNLRKLEYFPPDPQLFKDLILNKSWNVRTEAAAVLCYYQFNSFDEIQPYFEMLFDDNPNVSRNTASSVKKIIPKSLFREQFQNRLLEVLNDDKLNENTRGELFISYCSLFPENLEDMIEDYEDIIKSKYIYRTLSGNITDSDFNYDYLSDKIEDSNEIELLDLLPALLELQNRYLNNDEYAALIVSTLSADKTSSISLICNGIQTPFIHHYQEILQEIIVDQVFRFRNNPYYVGAILSLSNLASRINIFFYSTILDIINQSSLYPLKKFAAVELSENIPNQKLSDTFIKIVGNAFRYRKASIETEKGNIIISFSPEFAPISVGNFVKLANEGFYNGVNFHRVVPDFVIQSGDTTGTGWGDPGFEIVSEFSPLSFQRGSVGMASTGKDTENSQWFIMHSEYPHLNGRYTNFGSVVEGIEVVNIIEEGDKVIKVVLLE